MIEAEVNNGGFAQYFFNEGTSAWFVALAFEEIGAPKTARICERAISVAFPSGLPDDRIPLRGAANDFSKDILEKLRALDQEFYLYPHNLTELLFDYIQRHPDEFGTVSELGDAYSPV